MCQRHLYFFGVSCSLASFSVVFFLNLIYSILKHYWLIQNWHILYISVWYTHACKKWQLLVLVWTITSSQNRPILSFASYHLVTEFTLFKSSVEVLYFSRHSFIRKSISLVWLPIFCLLWFGINYCKQKLNKTHLCRTAVQEARFSELLPDIKLLQDPLLVLQPECCYKQWKK